MTGGDGVGRILMRRSAGGEGDWRNEFRPTLFCTPQVIDEFGNISRKLRGPLQ